MNLGAEVPPADNSHRHARSRRPGSAGDSRSRPRSSMHPRHRTRWQPMRRRARSWAAKRRPNLEYIPRSHTARFW